VATLEVTGMKRKVLVVDDSATARQHVVRELSAEFDCVAVESAEKALESISTLRPNAIVSDLEMGGMGGIQLLKELKSRSEATDIPVIIVTSVMAVEQMNECRALGCAGFVLKPVDGAYLRAKLTRLLAG
jgi:CheY-like chemotaxis protein